MATSQYGLIATDPKKKFATQVASGVDPNEDQSGNTQLPTANFSKLPTIQAPTVAVGPAPAVHQANIPANFQFTGAYEAANRALAQQESDASLQRRNSIADLDSQYRDILQKGADLQAIARTQLQENLASRGLMMSGINAQASGQQEKSYNQALADAAQARARGLSGIEGDYANVLNELARRREGLFYDQQKEEEAKRLQQEQLKAQAEAQRVQAEQQAAMLAQIQAAQETARQAAMAAAAASQLPRYSAPSLPAYGGGGGYAPEPTAAPNNNIVLPNFQSEQQARGWVRDTLDRNASDEAVGQVINYLMRAGANGLPLSDIAWLIQQYPNQSSPVSKSDVGGKIYGGRFF